MFNLVHYKVVTLDCYDSLSICITHLLSFGVGGYLVAGRRESGHILKNHVRIAYFQELDSFLDRTHCEGRLGRYVIALLPVLRSLVSFHRH